MFSLSKFTLWNYGSRIVIVLNALNANSILSFIVWYGLHKADLNGTTSNNERRFSSKT